MRWLFWPALSLMIILSLLSTTRIDFDENINQLLPQKDGQQMVDYESFSSITERIVFIIYSTTGIAGNREALIRYGDDFFKYLDSLKAVHLIKSVQYEFSNAQNLALFDLFYEHLPVFLEAGDYRHFDTLLTDDNIAETLEAGYRTLLTPAGMMYKDLFVKDPLNLTQPVLSRLKTLQANTNLSFIDGHMFSKDGDKLVFSIIPSSTYNKTAANSKLFKGIDQKISLLNQTHPDVDVRYFGAPVVASGNSAQIRQDITLTVALAIILIFALIYFYFRRLEYAFLIIMPAIIGGTMALGIMAWFKDSISVISLGVGAILLGITVDYALHVLNHFREKGSVKAIFRDLSGPVLMSAATTISAFLCLLALHTEALHDLALFSAISIAIAALFSLYILPKFLKGYVPSSRNAVVNWIDKAANPDTLQHPFIIVMILLLPMAALFVPGKVAFDKDLDHINYMSDKTREARDMLDPLLGVSQKNILLTARGSDVQSALAVNEQVYAQYLNLKSQHEASGLFGISTLLRSDSVQENRIRRWKEYWTREKQDQLHRQIQKESKILGIKAHVFAPFYRMLAKGYRPLDTGSVNQIAETFYPGLIRAKNGFTKIESILRVDKAYEDTALKQFKKLTNVEAFSKKDMIHRLVRYLQESFSKLVWYSMAAVFLILLIFLGRIELAFLGFAPIVMSWVFLLGIMKLAGIQFNIVNIIVSTFIFGLGIDYSIFILKGMMQGYATGRENIRSYRKSILLSALTTLIGIGVLVLARHPALKSIAIVAIPGILSVLIITYTIEPLLFRFLIYSGKRKRWVPLTFGDLWISFFGIGTFILGSVTASVSVFFISALPLKLKRRKLLLHHLLQKMSWFLIFFRITIKTRFINDQRESLKTPSLIIANHQSPLDVPLLLSFHPKLLILTKDWVQKTWIFRFFVKFADFHDMTSGLDDRLLKTLKEMVEDGYSIVVFPEGTRSEKGQILRFKKGAFLLAEQLKLDIQPIYIHGSWRCLTKNEPVVRSGLMTVKFLDRVRYDDPNYGATLLERSRAFRKLFVRERGVLQSQIERPAYFRTQLIRNFIYKGPVLEWYLRIKLRIENNYEQFDRILPRSGPITDLGCGYGFISYMMHFTSEDRMITGMDYDHVKIETANHCVSKSDQIRFIYADITTTNLRKSSAFLLADVLHYFSHEAQEQLLMKCINALMPGGLILIREGDELETGGHKWTLLTEFISTRITRFNKSGKKLYFTSEKRLRKIALENGCTLTGQKDSSLTSNTLFIIKKRTTRKTD